MSFSFGTPASAPATGLNTSFSFGANKPATPGFGAAAAQPSTGLFGGAANTSTPSFGAATPAFGTTATPAFGATSGAPAFGATTSTPAFGATQTPAFGATQTPAFGAAQTPAFGATQAQLQAGSTNTSTLGGTNPPSFGSALGSGGLNFGAGSNVSAPTTGLSFGAPAATAVNTGLGGLGGFSFATTTAQSNLGLGFGASTTAGANLFGSTLGAAPQQITSVAPNLGGLGGIAPTSTGTAASNADGKTESPKQTKLPNEISTTVSSFKEFVKKQKSLSSDIMRASIKPLHQVSKDAESTLQATLQLASELSHSRSHSKKLRSSVATALATAEQISQYGIDLEGSAPQLYVKNLILELEHQLVLFRRQMDVADKQMQASPKTLSEQELTLGIRRMHESVIALAGRLQTVHSQVEAQKEQYLNLRKTMLKDNTNVFENTTLSSLDQILQDAEGARKRTKFGTSDNTFGSAVLSDPQVVLGSVSMNQLAGPTPFTYIANSFSPYHHPVDNNGSNWQPQQLSTPNLSNNLINFQSHSTPESTSAFQLQKPPNKRGKP